MAVSATEFTRLEVGAASGDVVERPLKRAGWVDAKRDDGLAAPVRRSRPRWHSRYVLFVGLSEWLIAAAAAVGISVLLRSTLEWNTAVAAVAFPFVWIACLSAAGAYGASRVGLGPEEYRAVGRAGFYLIAAVAVSSSLLEVPLPRAFLTVVAPAVFVLTLVSRRISRSGLAHARAAGRSLQRVVVVGRGPEVRDLINEILENPGETGLEVVAACVADVDMQGVGVPFYGTPESAVSAVDDLDADCAVVLSHPDYSGRSLRRLSWALADRSVELLVAPGIAEVDAARLSLQPRAGLSLLHVERPIMSGLKLAIKRVTDAVLSLILVAVSVIPMLAIALAVWINDRGPVFYRQERVGEFGDTFLMFKFRTMVVDADARLARGELRDVNRTNERLFKDPLDPRVTRIGRLLRRYSIDELPQLINVMRGEMSLVGPRPPLPTEVATYEPDEKQRLRVRPGMTGLWQISGRSDLSWEQSVRLDLWYVDNWTPLFDLQVLARTAHAVFAGRGAY